ncbi:hypothetical protein [Knoellia aerolata]|nr:hypothetical protein [Knoellia aerolata]
MTTPANPPAAQPNPPVDNSELSRKLTPARLSTGVIIILLITMFASCSAASSAQDAANSSANQPVSDTSGLATTEEVQAMCRLLGAVATKQGTDVTAVFTDNQTGTMCEQAAIEASRPRH